MPEGHRSAGSPTIIGTATALPENHVDQETLTEALRAHWAGAHHNVERLGQLHRAVGVRGRRLALPLERYASLQGFGARNDAWIACGVDLGEKAARAALSGAGLSPRDIDHVFFVTVTGVATPSVDARLVNRLGMRSDVKRTPIFGLGCVAGASGLTRAADYLRAFDGETALLLSVELCSLTMQREDMSIANVIASGLFADGAAAAVISRRAGAQGPAVVASSSVFYPDTERVMGWDVVDTGFKVVLSARVPELVREHVRGDVDGFLERHGLSRRDVRHWVAHTGGPRVLEAFETSLELPPGALARSWSSLRELGNLSSASVLFVLDELLRSAEAARGDVGVLMAMGPGFCAELVLLRW